MKFEYKVEVVHNYCTDALDRALERAGKLGFELTSVVMANNRYKVPSMYLFFKRTVSTEEIICRG